MTVDKLRELYSDATRQMHKLNVAEAEFKAAMAQALAACCAPPGWAIDIHGDGACKPKEQCSPPKPTSPK